jgi:hypothetical protein
MGNMRHPSSQNPAPGIDFNGVSRTSLPEGVDPDQGRNLATPYLEEQLYKQTFSGIDYHITAIIPMAEDYDLTAGTEVNRLSGALATLHARLSFAQESVRFNQQMGFADALALSVQEAAVAAQEIASVSQALEDAQRQERSTVHFKTFAEIQTISITTRRSVHPVRRLGEKFPAYYTRGPRTIAGSMIFIQLDGDPLLDLSRRTEHDNLDGEPSFSVDRLPPFNILITGINEAGHMVQGALFDVTIIAGGTTFSVDDMYTEQQHTYVARYLTPMTSIERGKSLLERFQLMPSRGLGAISELEVLPSSFRTGGSVNRGTLQPPRNQERSNRSRGSNFG